MVDVPTTEFTEWDASVDDHGVATVELTHDKSAINDRGLVEFRDTLEWVVNQDEVAVIVLAGGPDAFCVGMDVESFAELVADTPTDSAERRRRLRAFIRQFHASIVEIREAHQPVVAAVDGMAAGGGFSLALASDLVYASPDASFTHAYTDLGATADGGSTYFLPRLVGLQKAKELVFTPHPASPSALEELGLVNEVIDESFEESVRERARTLADRPADAIAHTKRLLNESFDSTMAAQLQSERRAFADIAGTETFERRVEAFVEREE